MSKKSMATRTRSSQNINLENMLNRFNDGKDRPFDPESKIEYLKEIVKDLFVKYTPKTHTYQITVLAEEQTPTDILDIIGSFFPWVIGKYSDNDLILAMNSAGHIMQVKEYTNRLEAYFFITERNKKVLRDIFIRFFKNELEV